ncbi:increased DNA methylation 1-like [Andrographis paniculata]|uniref:increased DNA methylation 1-like n=1 Tax=Andrographis paniculata TaxID=175694 RepID=UPI0021E7CD2C|nr:increased DNA methylation 1-like [Andrographis paniculata]XP_051127268.1 increased DNA methylation 1-like [Andrographis paniculata]
MLVEMGEGSVEFEDELIDLNKEPVEKKRKRVDQTSSDGRNEGTNGLPKGGRVLRSRTLAMSDGEKQVITMEIVKMDDNKVSSGASVLENKDESNEAVLHEKETTKRKRGRPPRTEGICKVSSLGVRKSGRRGRPPKAESKFDVPITRKTKKKGRRGRPPKMEWNGNGEVSTLSGRKVSGICNGNGNGNGAKRKPGRPRKIDLEDVGLLPDKEVAKTSMDDEQVSENVVSVKKFKVGESSLGSGGVVKQTRRIATTGDKELGLREQKQLVRDQILAMLMKAGWTVEHRQRQSKEYKDAVYVDRAGKTHWSITLAYKKFKDRIDKGQADSVDIAAFNLIPVETLSMLFRITEKGKKAGKKNGVGGKTIHRKTKNDVLKIKSFDGNSKSKLNQGKRRTLVARGPTGSDSGGDELYKGSRSLLSWMIDLGTVSLGDKVNYRRGKDKKILLEGRVLREGICCDCCEAMHTVWDFELHARSSLGKPYQNIFLESGDSLFRCLLGSWQKHVKVDNIGFVSVDLEGDDPNDDTCNVCGDGGDLICCDSCPSTFHHGCLHAEVPPGDWYCAFCSCKVCGMACKISSVCDDEDEDDLMFSDFFTCRLCEEKFHVNCIKGASVEGLDEENQPFCGEECSEIFEQIQVILGVRHELEDGYSYTILQHCPVSGNASCDDDSSKVECNSKLAIAFRVMDECFEPIIDERSGTNMIHNVIYSCGSNVRRLNFVGFYTIILEKGEELVSVASIRIHGSQLAEMPFIGTRFLYRRQGMCSRLLAAIETVLRSVGVEKLVIPAISELNETWTKVFGFEGLEELERQKMKHMSMIVFPGVAMLKKPLALALALPHSGNVEMKSAAECSEDGGQMHQQHMQESPPPPPTGPITTQVKAQNQVVDDDDAQDEDKNKDSSKYNAAAEALERG